jgi:hypothetical protein
MNRLITAAAAFGLAASATAVVGCGSSAPPQASTPATATAQGKGPAALDPEVVAERAKLSPEDRALVEAQEWCVINNDERLGSMGPPVKLTVNGQPVFICCEGCQKKALADPDKTLAKLEELKAKAKAEHQAK